MVMLDLHTSLSVHVSAYMGQQNYNYRVDHESCVFALPLPAVEIALDLVTQTK